MKRKFIVSCLVLFFAGAGYSQTKPYNVVFDLTSPDTARHRTVIRWIDLIMSERADAQIEVVYYGMSLAMVTKGKSTTADDIQRIISKNKNVHFKVCEFAMKHHNIDKSQLLPGVETVPDGIFEIVTKQSEGYGYIKAAQ